MSNAVPSPRRGRRGAVILGQDRSACDAFHALEPRVFLTAAPVEFHDAIRVGAAVESAAAVEAEPRFATIPALNSLLGAKAQLYLDFDGDPATEWEGYDVTATPAYDLDGDPTTFTDAEVNAIQRIWAAVAEKFSPFNLNVTTVKPAALTDNVALRAVVGGKGEWTGGQHGGIAYVGGFFNTLSNTVYVFPENLAGGHPPYVAEAIAHEAGHGFGLEHQSEYDSSGNLVEQYHAGDGTAAPIMGDSYDERGIWWYGQTADSATTFQDDVSLLAGDKNGFGYRKDDHGDTYPAATALSIVGNQGNGAGVIEKRADRDYFSFVTGSGNVTLTASPAAFGAMLDLRLALYAHDGTLISIQDSPMLGETIAMYLDAGSYYLGVLSADDYPGDIGQFTVSATLITPTTTLPAPTNFAASALPDDGGIQLSWTDNATSELGYYVQRSTDGGKTWLDHAVTGSNATSYLDGSATAGGVYKYRIYAYDDAAVSPTTPAQGVALVPDVPAGVAVASITSRRVRLTWNAIEGATTYVIERGKADTTTFKAIGLAGGTGFTDTGLSPGGTYHYRVRAANAGGFSDPSASLKTTTLLESGTPDAPSDLLVKRKSSYRIRLAWQDNSDDEIGFRIQWTTPKRKWETLGTVAADKTSVTLYLWRDDASFRVAAYNKKGRSAFTDETAIAARRVTASPTAALNALFSEQRIARKALASLFKNEPKLLA